MLSGRPHCSLPIRFDRSYVDRAAETRGRDARGHLDRSVEVIGLEDVVTGGGSHGVDERTLGGERLAVVYPDGGGLLGKSERKTGGNTGRVVDRCVLGDERLPVVLRQIRQPGPVGALIDEQQPESHAR
jgi:hypothetical protein